MKKALVVIDMQNDFITGALGTPEARAIVPAAAARIRAAKEAEMKLVFTQDTHGADYLSTAEGKKLPVVHTVKPSDGWALAPELVPYAKDAVVIEKPTFGAAALPQYLSDCGEITLIGLDTDICVLSNAILLKAFLPEARICVDSACCAGVTPQSHKNALEAMKMCQIEIL